MLDPNFVLDDDGRERLITRFGAGVDAWCAVLPEMVELYCLRWLRHRPQDGTTQLLLRLAASN